MYLIFCKSTRNCLKRIINTKKHIRYNSSQYNCKKEDAEQLYNSTVDTLSMLGNYDDCADYLDKGIVPTYLRNLISPPSGIQNTNSSTSVHQDQPRCVPSSSSCNISGHNTLKWIFQQFYRTLS